MARPLKRFPRWLKGQMSMTGINQEELAKLLCISQAGVSYKISHSAFTFDEALKIMDYMDVPDDERLAAVKRK